MWVDVHLFKILLSSLEPYGTLGLLHKFGFNLIVSSNNALQFTLRRAYTSTCVSTDKLTDITLFYVTVKQDVRANDFQRLQVPKTLQFTDEYTVYAQGNACDAPM